MMLYSKKTYAKVILEYSSTDYNSDAKLTSDFKSELLPLHSPLLRQSLLPPLLLPGCGGSAPCAIAGHDVSLFLTRSGGESELLVGNSCGCPV